ncbi:response regulator [Calditrichota bacterium LG25]
MIEMNKAVSFNTFFFLEFMDAVIERLGDQFDPRAKTFLQRFKNTVAQAADPIETLESMAQYQQTNEMTIFLFDLLNRLEKIPPQQAMESLEGLAADFINLFSLMMEDEEVLQGLSAVEEHFAPLEEAPAETAHKEEPEPTVSFEEFYPAFIKEQIRQTAAPDEKDVLETLLDIILASLHRGENWPEPLKTTAEKLKELLPENLAEKSPTQLMELSKTYIPAIAEELKTLKKDHSDLMESILSTGQIPVEEEKGEETIDDLLKAYFYSEVQDHVKILEELTARPMNQENLAQLIKTLRSLKELSMIHGYTGVEFFCENMIRLIRNRQNQILELPGAAVNVFEEMLAVLKDVEGFESELTAGEQQQRVEEFEQKLQQALEPQAAPAEPAIEEETAAKEETEIKEEQKEKEEAEPLITLDDDARIYEVFKDLVQKLTQRLAPFSEKASATLFLDALESLQQTAGWVERSLPDEFLIPFKERYQQAISNPEIDRQAALQALEAIWENFMAQIEADGDFQLVKAGLKDFDVQMFVKVKRYAAEEKEVQKALAEVSRAQWQGVKPLLADALLQRDPQALKKVDHFLDQLEGNLRLLALDNYLELPNFLKERLHNAELKADEDLAAEISRSVEIVLERIEQRGAKGDAGDLVGVLRELTTFTEKEAELSEDEKDFIEDSLQHLQAAKETLARLKEEPEKRERFNELAAEIHAIYSGAQILSLERTADASLIVEETAEMFSDAQVEIPQNLLPALEHALQALEQLVQNPQAEAGEAFQELQNILDRLVLEEDGGLTSETTEEPEVAPEPVTEKPLFSPDETDEKELKEIFKEDALALIMELQKANAVLLKNPTDDAAIYEMDQAIHALKNAARMTGQDDLSIVLGRMEEISEEIKTNPNANSPEVQKELKSVIDELNAVVVKGQIETVELDSLLLKLDSIFNTLLSAKKSEAEREQRLKELFLEEGRELVEKINNDLLELEKVPESSTVLADLLRHLHTLKGGALMANFKKIGEVAHKLEDYFQMYRSQNAETKLELLPTAFTMIDLISEMLRAVEIGKPEIVSNFTARLADMDNKLFFLKDFEIPGDRLEQIPTIATRPAEPVATQDSDNTLKVKTSYLDHLINLATEMLISRTELNSYFDKLKNLFYEIDNRKKDLRAFAHQLEDFVEERTFSELKSMAPPSTEDWETLRNYSEIIKSISGDYYKTTGAMTKVIRFLERHISQLSVLSKSLHNDLLKARMVPIASLFERFKRPIRDLAREQKKEVELIIEDNDAEMDRAMIEALYEPLLHILRNAVDHGIEKSSERKKAGKDPVAKIILRARQEKNQVVIEVVDDGRGIDLEKVRKKIVSLKLATAEEAASMPESRLLEYIFWPEFSTKGKATQTSGRGIGLDVVAMELQKLKGIIRVKTTPGQGTVFSLRVPLTLIVSHAMLIKFHDISLAIPLLAVMESIKISEKDILLDDRRKYIQVRGKLLPYIDLDDILKFPHESQVKPSVKNVALVLHDSGVSVAVGVEEILGRQDIIIKNLGNLLQNVELISGGTILPDGEVALILDYAAIIHRVESEYFGAMREQVLIRKVLPKTRKKVVKAEEPRPSVSEITVKTVVGRKPRIMVVDDSASVRSFVSGFLKKHGFETVEATDGEDALQKARETEIDLVITDLQMPKMDGFKLSEQLRAIEKYKNLPIIILTAQVGKKQEQKSEAVGANAFVSKPFKEDDLIRMVKTFVKVE